MPTWNRRQLLQRAGLAGVGAASGLTLGPFGTRRSLAQEAEPRFLVVVGASGGGSIIDSAMALRESECGADANVLACYPDAAVHDIADSPFRAVQWSGGSVGAIPAPFASDQRGFFGKRKDDLVVATVQGTSVNHQVGQRRSVTGNEAWAGRTLQELTALTYGASHPLPNVHLATSTDFTARGTDDSLPPWCFGETVSDPRLWPLSLDGLAGIGGLDRSSLDTARAFRNRRDAASPFAQRRPSDPRLARWAALRSEQGPRLEAAQLVDKLIFLEESAEIPLGEYGLSAGPAAAKVREAFPRYLEDPFEAQAALAFLLLANQVSVTVTLAPSFNATIQNESGGLEEEDLINPPIAFDFSHQSHRATQAVMWERVLGVVDRLADLLATEPLGTGGESLWDRTVIYVPTEFGRTKVRPAGAADFGSGHDLNNGVMVLSPMVRGNRVLGGIEPNTGRTFGWAPSDGTATPGQTSSEAQIFAGILETLGIDVSEGGLNTVSAIRG